MKQLFIIFLLVFPFSLWSQQPQALHQSPANMEWFKDAKLGIFIHYGIYAVNGIDESWSFFNGYLTHRDYMKQLEGFTAAQYDAGRWAKAFEDAGARYAVLTTKHHDGVALWDTQTDHYSVVKHTPAGRDLIKPFVEALQEHDLKVGFYFSLIDWSHPDYPAFTRDKKRYENDPERWGRFVDFYFEQMRELSGRFNPDLYWFDGDWEHSAGEWRAPELKSMLLGYNKNLIINSRLQGYGDYDTPEQGVPVTPPLSDYWELCLTINDSWGYQHNDHNYKTPWQVVQIFTDCISMGGNLLLDVGPMANGAIPEPQLQVLAALGRWNRKHAEAVYGTRAGLKPGHFLGPTAWSKEHKTLYLYIPHQPNGTLWLSGVEGNIEDVRVVGTHASLKYQYADHRLSFELPASLQDTMMTVVAVNFQETPLIIDDSFNHFEQMTASLEDNRRWQAKHEVLPENLTEGISTRHYNGLSRLSPDKQILFLYLDGKPNGPLTIKGLKNKINRIWVVGDGTKLTHKVMGKLYWSNVPGMTYIDVPERVLDDEMTVIAVLLDGEIELYKERGQVIESN